MKYIKTILLIDENEIEARELIEILTSHGYRVGFGW